MEEDAVGNDRCYELFAQLWDWEDVGEIRCLGGFEDLLEREGLLENKNVLGYDLRKTISVLTLTAFHCRRLVHGP